MLREGWEPTRAHGLPQTFAAVEYAERMHAGQLRGDGTPFVLHPLEVGFLLSSAGAPDHVIAAGVLHDLIEKTGVTPGELGDRFGPTVTTLVLAVTDNEQIEGYAIRKAALRRQVARAGDEALEIFAADKLSKLRELRREMAADHDPGPTAVWRREQSVRRVKHYRRSLAMLEQRLPGSPLVHELAAEVRALPHDRAA